MNDSSAAATDSAAPPRPRRNWRESFRKGAKRTQRWGSRGVKASGIVLNRLFRPGTRDWACAAHLLPITVFAIPGIGFRPVAILVAFLVWRTRGDQPAVEDQGLEALNFQINLLVWSLLAYSAQALSPIPIGGAVLGVLIDVAGSLLAVVAGMRTAQGTRWTYPLLLRVVR